MTCVQEASAQDFSDAEAVLALEVQDHRLFILPVDGRLSKAPQPVGALPRQRRLCDWRLQAVGMLSIGKGLTVASITGVRHHAATVPPR